VIFHWLLCVKYQSSHSTCGACLEVVFELSEEQPMSVD
jgi:hypothetical protein